MRQNPPNSYYSSLVMLGGYRAKKDVGELHTAVQKKPQEKRSKFDRNALETPKKRSWRCAQCLLHY